MFSSLMFSSLLKGRLRKTLLVLLMAGAIVAIALPGVAGKKNITLLACSEGSHTDGALPIPPLVDSCQASGGPAQAACTQPACIVDPNETCAACLKLLQDAGCKRKEVGFSCVGPDVVRINQTVGIQCVKNFVLECPD